MVSKTSIVNDTHPIFQCARAQSALQEPHEQQPPSLSDPMKHCDATLVQHYVRRCVCVLGGPQVSRHNLLCHGTIYFLTAQLTFSRGRSIFAAEVRGIRTKRTQSPLGQVPRQNRFHFPSWLPTMKMWCKYELFIFSLSYLNILKGLLLACI